jgi:type IV pilus assembly protein PilV
MSIKICKENINKKQSGFTLIEVMIALVILAVGLLALMTLQIVSIRANAFSSDMTYAGTLAQSRIEHLRNTAYDSIAPNTDFEYDDPDHHTYTSAKGTSYTVKRLVEDNTPATDMKTITMKIEWVGAPAGSSGGSTVDFETSFVTVIKK